MAWIHSFKPSGSRRVVQPLRIQQETVNEYARDSGKAAHFIRSKFDPNQIRRRAVTVSLRFASKLVSAEIEFLQPNLKET
jgi:hypothetical protein